MQCPVCHGFGLSPAAALLDRVVACDGCNGAGWLEDPNDTATASQRHDGRMFATDQARVVTDTEDWSDLDPVEQLEHLLDIDRRHRAEMPNALPGRAQPETAARLLGVVTDYRRLAAATDGGLPGLEPVAIDRKLADALRTLGQARESVHDPDGAETVYEEARWLYRALGATQELDGVAASLRELRLHRSRDVGTSLEELRATLAATRDGLTRAQLLIELGEIHASRHDDLEAEGLFRSAERELEPHRDKATTAGMADALTASLPMLMSGEVPSLFAEFESITRVTSLLQRLYAGLTQALADVDPAEAQRYAELRNALQGGLADGNRNELDFPRRIRDGLIDADRRPPGTDQDAT